MARVARAELFTPREIAIVHVINRVVRRCFLLGEDPESGKNYDHRKQWIEEKLKHLAAYFAIDLLAYACLSNHVHLVLRSRPDIVDGWDDTEVARRWLMICPGGRKSKEPSETDLNSIRTDPDKLAEVREHLSDISHWMKLLNQTTARRANLEDEQVGHFWYDRFHAVRLLDEAAVLACAAYVDLNPIRAAMAETIETSDFTSGQARCAAAAQAASETANTTGGAAACKPDGSLAPVQLDEQHDPASPRPSREQTRASDKGFLPMRDTDYLLLLDWTARQAVPGKNPAGVTPKQIPPILKRLNLQPEVWMLLVAEFGRMFSRVAGQPHRIDEHRGSMRGASYHIPATTRQLLTG